MLVPNQLIEIKWNRKNKKWFENKGYEFTDYNDLFFVKAEDLMPHTKTLVNVQCDYCGEIVEKTFSQYNDDLKKVKKNTCGKQECRNKKVADVWHETNTAQQMEKFYQICKEKGYTPLSTVNDYCGSKSKLKFLCPLHGEQETIYDSFVNGGHGCNKCGWQKIGDFQRMPIEDVISIVESKNNNKLLNPEDYIDTRTKNLLVRCGSCGEVSLRSLSSIMNSQDGACEKCGGKKNGGWSKYSTDDVKRIVESKNGNKVLNLEDYINVTEKNLLIQCGICGEITVRSLASIMVSETCEYCARKSRGEKSRLSIEEVKDRIESVNNNKWLNPDEYVSCRKTKLKIQCGECGNVYTTSLANYEWHDCIRCPECSGRISKLERRVIDFLDYYHIPYEREKQFEDCKDVRYLPFDFYLPDYNLIIETDGQGHYEPVFGEESFMRTLLHDGMKNNYCKWNDIDLLRIPYFQGSKTEEILSQKLGVGNGFQKIPYKTHNHQNFGDHFKDHKTT